MDRSACVALSALCLAATATVGTGEARANVPEPSATARANHEATLQLAMAIRERALSSSFASLSAFADEARIRADEQSPRKLQHTINILIDHSEFDAALSWNRELEAIAKKQGQSHYVEVAKINRFLITRLRNGVGSSSQAEFLAEQQDHWLAQVYARQAQARVLLDEMQPAEAMRILARAMPLIATKDIDGSEAAASLWGSIAVVHSSIDDLSGFTNAVWEAEKFKSRSGFPEPDYDALYLLAFSLGAVGRFDEATSVVSIYGELAEQAGTPMAQALSANICGLAATAADNWHKVLECYAPVSEMEDVPPSIMQLVLPRRAAAYARTGKPELALKDLKVVREMLARGEMRRALAVDRAEAEYLLSKGDYVQGLAALRAYYLKMYRVAAQRSSTMMEQAVISMDERLMQAEEQADLKSKTISAQRWLVALGALLGFVFGAMFLRQRSLARRLSEINRKQRLEQDRQAEFFTNISHEIRTPLNGVVAMADALGKEDLSPEAAKMARIISSSSDTLERLMSDLLDSAKIAAGQISLDLAPFSLKQTMLDVAALWRPKAFAKGLQIKTQFEDDGDLWVIGDRVRIAQVLNNLVSNALKFTSAGRIAISLVVQKDDRYLFAVTDSGIGFDMQSKEQLFERFRQAESTITRRFGGTGLGLPISRQLVELMGGQLDCESETGKGAQFWFELHLPKADTSAEPREAIGDVGDLSGASRYLIVDDNATNRTILAMLLKDELRQLHFAENGREAVDLAATIPFDVILMDMQMPVMSGIEAIKAIRLHEKTNKLSGATIVILSANADAHHKKEGAEAGADGHIAKPIVLERLLEGIEQAVHKRAQGLAEAG